MKDLKEKLEYYSRNIAVEICDKPSFDVAEIQLTIKTRMLMALKEMTESKTTLLERKINDLKDEYLSDVPNWRKEDIKRSLVNLNAEMKIYNKTMSEIKNTDEYNLLKIYVRENFGNEAMDKFYKIINKK